MDAIKNTSSRKSSRSAIKSQWEPKHKTDSYILASGYFINPMMLINRRRNWTATGPARSSRHRLEDQPSLQYDMTA